MFKISHLNNLNLNIYSIFRFLLYDCDPFTRDYYKDILQIIQPDSIEVFNPKDNFPTVSKLVIILKITQSILLSE